MRLVKAIPVSTAAVLAHLITFILSINVSLIQPGAAAGPFCLLPNKHAKVGIGQQADFIRADGILRVDAKMASFCPSDLTAFE